MDENRLLGSDSHGLRLLEDLIRRDRNHPSVVIWSIANEEWAVQGNDMGARVAATMQALVKPLDPSRPATGGNLQKARCRTRQGENGWGW